MGRTVAELRALREQLTRRRWQAANAVTDDLDGAGLDTLVTLDAAISALDKVIAEGRDEP